MRETVSEIASPQACIKLAEVAIQQLYSSLKDDYRRSHFIAWLTRIRQIEELYFRSLYVLFFAESDEIPHIVSGVNPNRFMHMYSRVNEEILCGHGQLVSMDIKLWGQTPMEILNDGAHVGFKTLHLASKKRYPTDRKDSLKHVGDYVRDMEQIRRLLATGRSRRVVCEDLKQRYRARFDRPPEASSRGGKRRVRL